MSLIDVLIPFAVGLLLVLRPNVFLKATGPAEEVARKSVTFKRSGYVLLGVSALYAVIALLRP